MTDGDYTVEVRRYLDETLPNEHSESVEFGAGRAQPELPRLRGEGPRVRLVTGSWIRLLLEEQAPTSTTPFSYSLPPTPSRSPTAWSRRIRRLALPTHRREVIGSPAPGLCHRRPRRRPLLRRDQLRPPSWKAASRMAPSAPLWETKASKLGPARRPHLHYLTRGRVPRARRELLSSLASLQRLT